VESDRLRFGERLAVSFQRTLRIPDDGRTYPLPPGLGRFPLRRAADHLRHLPGAWRDDFFIPMYRREALWIGFDGAWWKPNAVKIGVGGVDALTGGAWDDELRDDPQNYVVVPDQPWIDGINSGSGTVRQFVATPLGEGSSVEAQLRGEERVGGFQLVAAEPKPGVFPDSEPPRDERDAAPLMMPEVMGIGAGGTMRQKIYPDPYGIDTWDPAQRASAFIHLLTAAEFEAVTGEAPPPTPVDAAAYAAAGLPWFELYDEEKADLAPAEILARIKTVRELEGRERETSVEIREGQTRTLRK
jgi:hypothetical protein